MSDHQFNILLSNIKKGLNKFGLNSFNHKLVGIVNKESVLSDEKDKILEIVSNYFNVSIESLMMKYSRGIVAEARNISICLMNSELDFSTRQIARVFNTSHTSIFKVIQILQNINIKIKQDREFLEKYNLVKIEVKKQLKSDGY